MIPAQRNSAYFACRPPAARAPHARCRKHTIAAKLIRQSSPQRIDSPSVVLVARQPWHPDSLYSFRGEPFDNRSWRSKRAGPSEPPTMTLPGPGKPASEMVGKAWQLPCTCSLDTENSPDRVPSPARARRYPEKSKHRRTRPAAHRSCRAFHDRSIVRQSDVE